MMMMVKLKMKSIYKTILSFIGILIIASIIMGISYMFYDRVIEADSDIEVNGLLSINYINGKKINVNEEEEITFTITNSGTKVIYYNITFLQIRGNGTYKLYYEDTLITEGELKTIDEISTNEISIDAKETKAYKLKIKNTGKNNLEGIIHIRDQASKIVSFSDIILENSKVVDNSTTKVGSEIATLDEGLIKSYDDIGVTYYFRGNVTNNYVSLGNKLWRIVRINGDGTVRLILDGITDSVSPYIDETSKSYAYNESVMLTYLKSWLDINLDDELDYLANTKFCNDIVADDTYNFNSYTRIMTNKIPTFNCLGDSHSSNIGLLTIDEVILAGASPTDGNRDYYLYNEEITDMWYTLSGAKGGDGFINMFMINYDGAIKTDVNSNLYRSVRPVINLIKNVEMTGKGTKENPYKLAE